MFAGEHVRKDCVIESLLGGRPCRVIGSIFGMTGDQPASKQRIQARLLAGDGDLAPEFLEGVKTA